MRSLTSPKHLEMTDHFDFGFQYYTIAIANYSFNVFYETENIASFCIAKIYDEIGMQF